MSAHPESAHPPGRVDPSERDAPLCVDLDGTLLRTDLLAEALVRFVRRNPLDAARALGWALRGRARLKAELAARVDIDPATLPVNAEFVDWLRDERRQRRRLVLCTAANERMAARIADYFGFFDEVIASTAECNLSGRVKAQRLATRFGEGRFDYAANEPKDLHVWRRARRAVVVAPKPLQTRVARASIRVERCFTVESGSLRAWLAALRLHQWTKNLLVFAPLAAAHRIDDSAAVLNCVLAFLLFSLCASGGYLANDLADLDADRNHPRKRARAFAAGRIPLTHGMAAAAALISFSLAAAWVLLPPLFAAALVVYLATSLWYSLALKRIAMVDVLSLAGLYTVRVVGGGLAIAVIPSFWLLAFSMFLFLSLAAAKRYAELRSMLNDGRMTTPGRGYSVADLPMLHASGMSGGYLAVLVLALYVNSGAAAFYSRPQLMWLLCPLLLYWVNRVWLKTFRGQMHDDPVVFALTDRPSLVVFAMSAALVVLAL